MIAWVYIDSRNLMHLDDEEMKTRYLKHHLGIHVALLPRDIDIAWIPCKKSKATFQKFRRYKSFIDSGRKGFKSLAFFMRKKAVMFTSY